MLGFNYEFHLQEDGVYGSIKNDTKEWTGMIRELLDGVYFQFVNNIASLDTQSLAYFKANLEIYMKTLGPRDMYKYTISIIDLAHMHE